VAVEQRTVVWPDNMVWLASYPRSGNTYLRSILWTCFGLQTGSIYPNDLSLDVAQHVGHFERAAHGLFPADFLQLPLVKTHEWPVDGRRAIYIVRNGRDSCCSLHQFLRASGYDVDLDTIIAGQAYFGSWSSHFLAWDPQARPNTLFLRFEQLTKDFEGTLDQLAGFLEMPAPRRTPEAHRRTRCRAALAKPRIDARRIDEKRPRGAVRPPARSRDGAAGLSDRPVSARSR